MCRVNSVTCTELLTIRISIRNRDQSLCIQQVLALLRLKRGRGSAVWVEDLINPYFCYILGRKCLLWLFTFSYKSGSNSACFQVFTMYQDVYQVISPAPSHILERKQDNKWEQGYWCGLGDRPLPYLISCFQHCLPACLMLKVILGVAFSLCDLGHMSSLLWSLFTSLDGC